MALQNRRQLEFGRVEATLQTTILENEQNFDRWMIAHGYAPDTRSEAVSEGTEKSGSVKKRRQRKSNR